MNINFNDEIYDQTKDFMAAKYIQEINEGIKDPVIHDAFKYAQRRLRYHQQPMADYVEVYHDPNNDLYFCTNCFQEFKGEEHSPYCYNCGAKFI